MSRYDGEGAVFPSLFPSVISYQLSGVRSQEAGDRVIGFWGDRVMRQLPYFPISLFPHFPTSPLPHFPTSPLPHFPTPHTPLP
ncbi:MAG: hypothetical protein PX636_06350, partial [Microcystis sp. M53598_WE2]|nr:hypothetical protein [Microcystis sp. M53598_WE2]